MCNSSAALCPVGGKLLLCGGTNVVIRHDALDGESDMMSLSGRANAIGSNDPQILAEPILCKMPAAK